MVSVALEPQLREFVACELRVAADRLLLETALQKNLGVDGEDGVEFMQSFAARFGVDISAFEPSRHFGPEAGFNPVLWAWWRATRPPLEPITIERLQGAMRAGRWK